MCINDLVLEGIDLIAVVLDLSGEIAVLHKQSVALVSESGDLSLQIYEAPITDVEYFPHLNSKCFAQYGYGLNARTFLLHGLGIEYSFDRIP